MFVFCKEYTSANFVTFEERDVGGDGAINDRARSTYLKERYVLSQRIDRDADGTDGSVNTYTTNDGTIDFELRFEYAANGDLQRFTRDDNGDQVYEVDIQYT